MDHDQQPQGRQDNARVARLEQRLNEMTVLVEEMSRRQSELQNELQRQRAQHEEDRKQWHEECQKMQAWIQRVVVSTTTPKPKSKLLSPKSEKPTTDSFGLLASSRMIKPVGTHSLNRPRILRSLSGGMRENLLEILREKRQILNNLERHKQAVETDEAATALNTLSLSDDESTQTSNTTDSPNLQGGSYGNQVKDIAKRSWRMQQQLTSVLHAQNCTSNKVDSLGNVKKCAMPLCLATTEVLEHMRTCTSVTSCETPMCSLTREVMYHFKNCKTLGCSICRPAKQETHSTQEQLLRYMDTICKDEDTPMEVPSISTVVITPPSNDFFDGLLSVPDPMFLPNLFSPMPFARQPEAQTQTDDEASTEMKIDGLDMHE